MASAIKPEHVQDQGNGCFTVKGEKSQSHRVSFGSETDYPSCTCTVWWRLLLPCKHFCAVFQHRALNWSWDQLSPAYKNNPLFHLDESVLVNDLHQATQATQSSETEGEAKAEENVEVEPKSSEDSGETATQEANGSRRPQRKTVTCKHLVRKNMDILDRIQSQVPMVKDQQLLEEMLDQLQKVLQKIQGRNRRTTAIQLRSSSRHAGKKKHSISNNGMQEASQASPRKDQLPEATSELSRGQSSQGAPSPSENGLPTQKIQDVGHKDKHDNGVPADESPVSQINSLQSKDKDSTTSTSSILSQSGDTSTQQGASRLDPQVHHHDIATPVPSNSKEVETSEEVPGDAIQAVIIKPDQYTYFPFKVSAGYPQGTSIQGTIVEHHDLHGNITFVTEDPSVSHQEILSTIIQAVDQGHQDSFIIDSAHPLQGVTVTVADSTLRESVPDDVT